jgi:hypothetical protein
MALNYVTVTGTFDDGSGNPIPAAGQNAYCLFTPSTQVFASGVPLITPAQPIQAAISGGALSQRLLATDNTGLTFGGLTGFFFWTVTMVINGQAQLPWSFFLPHTPTTIDLSLLANTAAGGGGGGFANPMTTLGDLMFENATPAAARLAGNATAAKQFLTQTGTGSVSAAPAWGTIAAGDVPGFDGVTVTGTPSAGQVPTATSGSAATWQPAPGVQSLTFTYGSTGAIPSSGTFTAGMVAVDQNDILRVCTSSGTPGTWRRAGAPAYQFYVDDYCKGDGKQALVTTVAGSAVINTTPLAAPAAPTLANTGSGGSLTSGTYQVKVTYVNRWGETVASSSTSQAITGTQPLTITAPALSGNATGWYAYVTQAGAGTYFRQQAAGSPTAMGVSLVLTTTPTTSGANPPGSDSSAAQVFTSTGVDGGKNIMICGGLGSPGGPWIDTIASVQSPTQATLSTNGAGQGGNVNQAGCPMVFSSDDRLNVDQCISDAKAYALANQNFCQVIGSDRIYGLGTGFFQSTVNVAGSNPTGLQYNTQVRIPVGNNSGETEKLEFQLLGPGDTAHAEFWVSQYVNLNGCTFASYSIGPTTPDPTYGQQSVIGGPLGGVNFALSAGFANTKAVIKGVQVVQPGWSNSIGIDLQWIGGILLRGSSQVFAPATGTGGGVNPSNGWVSSGAWQSKIGIGLRAPNAGNNDDCVIESFAVEGLTTGLCSEADHLVISRLVTINGYFGIQQNNATSHALTIAQWSFEGIAGGALRVISGGGNPCNVNIAMDGENPDGAIIYDVQDNNNDLRGIIRWNDSFRTTANAPTIQGCANVEIINGNIGRSVQVAPSYTLGTAFQNPWWRHAWVTLSGGTTTGILIGPTSAACTTSMGTTTPVTFRLPSGWWLNIQGSVKPTTFNAVLD